MLELFTSFRERMYSTRSLVVIVVTTCLLASLFVGVVHGGVAILTPTPRRSPSPRTPTPLTGSGTTVLDFVPLLQQGSAFNETVTVPVMERLDAGAPTPAMCVAEDFTVPLAIQTCSGLVADIVIFRQMGRENVNYNYPEKTTLWLFPFNALVGPFNESKAIAKWTFTTPTEGSWDPVGSSGGTTVDKGAGYYIHYERYRFRIYNVILRANTTYWIVALVSLSRNYSSTDFSQNLVRVATSETSTVQMMGTNNTTTTVQPYRVVDWHGNVFRDHPQLSNWTSADLAEPIVLPFTTSLSVTQSHTRQLAIDIYGTDCVNLTRLFGGVTALTQLPRRDWNPEPVPTSSPSINEPPSSIPPSVGTPSPTSTISTPVVIASYPTPVMFASPVASTSPSSSTGPALTPTVTPVTTPSSVWIQPVPIVISNAPSPATPVVPNEQTQVPSGGKQQQQSLDIAQWIIVSVAAVAAIAILGIVFVFIVRLKYKVNYDKLPHDDYAMETNANSSVEEAGQPLDTYDDNSDAPDIRPKKDTDKIILEREEDDENDTK